MNSSSKPSSLVRNQNLVLNGPSSAASQTANGILVTKDEIFHKNKTFNYPKESSTSRGGDPFQAINSMDQRRQRSSKAPTMAGLEGQKQGSAGIEALGIKSKANHNSVTGHFTPQLMMSSQSES